MAREIGLVFTPDAQFHFVYDQRLSFALPTLYGRREHAAERLNNLLFDECECFSPEIIAVELAADGWRWNGRACVRCERLVDGLQPLASEFPPVVDLSFAA